MLQKSEFHALPTMLCCWRRAGNFRENSTSMGSNGYPRVSGSTICGSHVDTSVQRNLFWELRRSRVRAPAAVVSQILKKIHRTEVSTWPPQIVQYCRVSMVHLMCNIWLTNRHGGSTLNLALANMRFFYACVAVWHHVPWRRVCQGL